MSSWQLFATDSDYNAILLIDFTDSSHKDICTITSGSGMSVHVEYGDITTTAFSHLGIERGPAASVWLAVLSEEFILLLGKVHRLAAWISGPSVAQYSYASAINFENIRTTLFLILSCQILYTLSYP